MLKVKRIFKHKRINEWIEDAKEKKEWKDEMKRVRNKWKEWMNHTRRSRWRWWSR